MRYEVVNLIRPPSVIFSGGIALRKDQGEFIQPVDRWTIYRYQHANALTVNARTYPVAEGAMAILPPGARVSHGWIGEGARVEFLTFDMPGVDGLRGAVPHVTSGLEATVPQWEAATGRIVDVVDGAFY